MLSETMRLLLLMFCLLLVPPALAGDAAVPDASGNPAALAVYQLGKALYDAGDYAGARTKFLEASKHEPANPRWHYNLGLVHRQMDNFQAARQSFMRARELAPDYKRAEIDQKLESMGFDPAAPADAQPASRHVERDSGVSWGLVATLVAGSAALLYFFVRRRSVTAPAAGQTKMPPDPTLVAAEERRLGELAAQLVAIEHAMRLGENPDMRAHLDYATRLETAARSHLASVRRGDGKALSQLKLALDDATDATGKAATLARDLYGTDALTGQGERIGCFFCARPLANPQYRRQVAIKRGTAQDTVLACPDCVALAESGEVGVRTAADGTTHWSEQADFDPYLQRHVDPVASRMVPAWRLQSARPVGELARLAGGGAMLAGAGVAMAGAAMLDLDAAQEAGLVREAARAAAERASAQRGESGFSDHS